MDFDNPDRECNECGASDWHQLTTGTPHGYGDDSEVVRYLYVCQNCRTDGRLYEEQGSIQYSAALR